MLVVHKGAISSQSKMRSKFIVYMEEEKLAFRK
jgi:hypothetical protein